MFKIREALLQLISDSKFEIRERGLKYFRFNIRDSRLGIHDYGLLPDVKLEIHKQGYGVRVGFKI